MRPFWKLLKESASRWNEHGAFRLSAALSYYSVFSMGPLLILATGIAGLVVYAFAASVYRQVVERDHLWGYGVFAPAAGAADFVERENIRGNLFNTYGIGGYLIHRWYPDPTRKVFIDGRNVDYGYDFMNAAFVAGHSPQE